MNQATIIFSFLLSSLLISVIVLSVLLRKQIQKRRKTEQKCKDDMKTYKDQIDSQKWKFGERCAAEKEKYNKECDEAVSTAKQQCVEEIAAAKLECEEEIRKARETIEHDREVLAKMDEKTLLVNTMMALEGYSQRFERIEKVLGQEIILEKINEWMQATEKNINEAATSTTQKVDEINDTLSDLKWDIENAKSAAEDAKDSAEKAYDMAEAAKDASESIKTEIQWQKMIS